MKLSLLDTSIVVVYLIAIFALAQFVSREKAGHKKTAEDYFPDGFVHDLLVKQPWSIAAFPERDAGSRYFGAGPVDLRTLSA